MNSKYIRGNEETQKDENVRSVPTGCKYIKTQITPESRYVKWYEKPGIHEKDNVEDESNEHRMGR